MYYINYFFEGRSYDGITNVAMLRNWKSVKAVIIEHYITYILEGEHDKDAIEQFASQIPDSVQDSDFNFKYFDHSVDLLTIGDGEFTYTVNKFRYLVEDDIRCK